jgi:DnaK suppressor protein
LSKKMLKKEKQVYRKKLLERKDRILKKLTAFYNDSKEIVEADVAQDVVDKAESSYTKEFLLSLSDAEREQLFQIDAALKRLDTDEFGICQVCQKEIGKKRLEALPWTALCIDDQEKAEQESQ